MSNWKEGTTGCVAFQVLLIAYMLCQKGRSGIRDVSSEASEVFLGYYCREVWSMESQREEEGAGELLR